jgi:limonene-1,2-epoxide hydrolase
MSAENEQLVRTFLAGTNTLDEYLAFFADDCIYRVSNQSNVIGKEALAQAAGRFRSSVERVEHRILKLWCVTDRVICELEAIYTRKDGKTVSLPCLDIFTIESGKIRSLKIFADLSPVFKP